LEVRQFQGHDRWVNQAVFSPDGQQAVSGSWDESIRIWNIHDMTQLIAWIRDNRYIRVLTCPEQEIYLVDPEQSDC
jgi:WD40 repeat protein